MKYQMPTKAEIRAGKLGQLRTDLKNGSVALFHAVVVAALVGGPLLYYIANIK